jgi:hypothetical protein
MNIHRLLVILALIAFGLRPLSAREVNVLTFWGSPAAKPTIDYTSFDASSGNAVAQVMREQFSREASMGQAFGVTHKVLRHLHLAGGWSASNAEMQRIAASRLSCDGATYSPTWWLPRATEIRRAQYFSIVASIACEHRLPTRLLDAAIAQESGYRPMAISTVGAMGVMQIMPGTARLLGLADPFDPVANMRAGARYLRQQLDRFGRIDLALAAYNAGPERRSLAAGYVPAIPETRNYIRTITTNWARLVRLGADPTNAEIRGNAAITTVRASGYRSVELVRYDGLNASNPM